MSKYTPEQVLHAADLEQAKYDGDLIISGYLRDYATLLRERESAKARVTHTMIREAKDAFENSSARDATGWWRSALEAVAPMLASARVPDGQCSGIRVCAHCGKPKMNCDCHDASGFHMLPGACGVSRMWDNEKAVLVSFERKPTDDELRALHDLLAAAPKPSSEASSSLSEALNILEHWARRGNTLAGDDVERFHAIADLVGPKPGKEG